MASQKIFVSPGVFTSEKELTFISQQVGVTTLGLAGETVKGPAFEPIFITNYEEYMTIFGGLNPEKFSNNKPKYELSYIAKWYLTQSNQLFVSRVLGLTGYDAGDSWSITALANYENGRGGNPTTIAVSIAANPFTVSYTGSTFAASVTDINADYLIAALNPYGPTVAAGDVLPDSGETSYNTFAGNYYAWPDGIYFVRDPYPAVSFTGYRIDWTGNTAGSNALEGVLAGTVTVYTASAMTAYDNVVLATLRSRGVYNQNDVFTWSTNQNNSGVVGDFSAGTPAGNDPLIEFSLSATAVNLTATTVYMGSLDSSSRNYLPGVLGVDCHDRGSRIYVEETYPAMLKYLYQNRYIVGLSPLLTYTQDAANYKQQYQTPETPWVVSELRGSEVIKLFKLVSISDGTAANTEIKISIQNINPETKTFDVVVRQYGDTDSKPSFLENFNKCNMDPASTNFVARRIGTTNGLFTLNSKFIMVVMNDNAPLDTFPAGFEGYHVRDYVDVTAPDTGTALAPFIPFKTKYNLETERIRKVYLGISDTTGFDTNMFYWKGLTEADEYWTGVTKGFHMDSGATIAGNFMCGEFEFRDSIGIQGTYYENNYARKFTFMPYFGFDGWDCFRTSRTNTDRYKIGKAGFTAGLANSGSHLNDPQFIQYDPQNGNSDLYAYWNNIRTFANPEAININVFATPGIDWSIQANGLGNNFLVQETIDLIEQERADSVYIVSSPENVVYDTQDPTIGFGFNSVTIEDSQTLVDLLDDADIDSNYTATYWPWIQERDNENNVNVWLPATLEVVRNIALTDNVAFPWYAVAGYNRGLTTALQARVKLNETDRDTLYAGRVNPMATFSDVGVVIWGNKNLQAKESIMDRLNIRRLLLQARKLISAVGIRLLFEQNDQIVRNQFLNLVNPILDNIRKERGLADFRVQLSNDPSEIDRHEMRGKIFLKPIPTLEFIIIEFNVTPTGASFDNI